jgi:hypothetical protein
LPNYVLRNFLHKRFAQSFAVLHLQKIARTNGFSTKCCFAQTFGTNIAQLFAQIVCNLFAQLYLLMLRRAKWY